MTLFARIVDPGGVARQLREIASDVKFDGPDDSWTHAVVTFWTKKRRLLSFGAKRKQVLTFTHDPAYYAEPNWSAQMNGMRGYFSGFPNTNRKERVMMLTSTLRFSLGILFDPDFEANDDPRLDIVFAVTELLDGVLFAPSSLRDARGRILFGAGGEDEEDPKAVWPRVIFEVPVSEPLGAAVHEASHPIPANEETARAHAPTPERVARRAVALAAVTNRAVLEQDAADPETPDVYRDLLTWVKDVGIDEEFEPDEWEVLQRPPGKLDAQMQINATWRLEGLVVLAWALGRIGLPPHDELVSTTPLWTCLGTYDADAAQALMADAVLRPREDIRKLRSELFALHWRLKNFHVHPGVMDFAEYARTCWFGPLDISDLPLIDGDLGLRGERLDRAKRDEFECAQSAALERHKAVNWLWEGPDRYSDASENT